MGIDLVEVVDLTCPHWRSCGLLMGVGVQQALGVREREEERRGWPGHSGPEALGEPSKLLISFSSSTHCLTLLDCSLFLPSQRLWLSLGQPRGRQDPFQVPLSLLNRQ